jgi:hypothetical protein
MSGRFQPTNGADSDYTLRHYRVLLEDDDGIGDRKWVDVAAAMGPRDAQNQAKLDNPYYVALKAELVDDYADARYAADEAAETAWKESVPESATFPEWMDWAGMKR